MPLPPYTFHLLSMVGTEPLGEHLHSTVLFSIPACSCCFSGEGEQPGGGQAERPGLSLQSGKSHYIWEAFPAGERRRGAGSSPRARLAETGSLSCGGEGQLWGPGWKGGSWPGCSGTRRVCRSPWAGSFHLSAPMSWQPPSHPNLLPAGILSVPGSQGHEMWNIGSGVQIFQAPLSSSAHLFGLSPHHRAQDTMRCLPSQEVGVPALLPLSL